MSRFNSIFRVVLFCVFRFISGGLIRFILFLIPLSFIAAVYITSTAVKSSAEGIVSEYRNFYHNDFAWLPEEEADLIRAEYDLAYRMDEVKTADNYTRTAGSLSSIAAVIYFFLGIYMSVNIAASNSRNESILHSLGFGNRSLFMILFLQITVLLSLAVLFAAAASVPISYHYLIPANILLEKSVVPAATLRMIFITILTAVIPVLYITGMIKRIK